MWSNGFPRYPKPDKVPYLCIYVPSEKISFPSNGRQISLVQTVPSRALPGFRVFPPPPPPPPPAPRLPFLFYCHDNSAGHKSFSVVIYYFPELNLFSNAFVFVKIEVKRKAYNNVMPRSVRPLSTALKPPVKPKICSCFFFCCCKNSLWKSLCSGDGIHYKADRVTHGE